MAYVGVVPVLGFRPPARATIVSYPWCDVPLGVDISHTLQQPFNPIENVRNKKVNEAGTSLVAQVSYSCRHPTEARVSYLSRANFSLHGSLFEAPPHTSLRPRYGGSLILSCLLVSCL